MKKKSNSSEEEFIYRNSPLNVSWRLKHQEIDRSPGSMQKLISLASNQNIFITRAIVAMVGKTWCGGGA